MSQKLGKNLSKHLMKITSIVGARPQFIKLAPIAKAIQEQIHVVLKIEMEHKIIHTGQHYDYQMDKVFFEELGIPDPEYNLEVGSASHGQQTGEMLKRAEEVLLKENPDFVLVYGDTNSTFAGAFVCAKLGIPVAHVEAGLRSYNRGMPEEINRILTDRCSDMLFCPTENACQNLKKEGISNIANKGKLMDLKSIDSIYLDQKFPIAVNVGDIMYDTVLLGLKIAEEKSNILKNLKLEPKKYFLATVHRAENSDDKEKLKNILAAFEEINKKILVVFPVHPRTKKNLELFNITPSVHKQILMMDPVSYLDMLILEKNAMKVLTDSGGIQKEAYFFDVPCITLREETEWIETLEGGSNTLVGTNKEKICHTAFTSQANKPPSLSPFGDGHTAERILSALSQIISLGS